MIFWVFYDPLSVLGITEHQVRWLSVMIKKVEKRSGCGLVKVKGHQQDIFSWQGIKPDGI